MIIENSFQVPLPRDETWRLLTDVSAIATCLPGASLREVDEHGGYHGELTVKLGPVRMTFDGSMRFTQVDPARGFAEVCAEAREIRNRGSANALIGFQLSELEDATGVAVTTDLALAGQAAQYGRAAGVVQKVATFMLDRFAACLADRLTRGTSSATAQASDAGD